MSSPQRRREKELERHAEDEAREQEQRRINSLAMWERIEEFGGNEEMKTILHALAEKCGLEN